jgi:hypothetical protein
LRKLHYFAALLCYSRLLFVEFYLSQSMECFLAANRHALEYFGASTRRAMHDNLKTAVLDRIPGYAPVFNPRYLDFAAHYGFKPVACNVGRGNEKGRVENSIGYIQKNFLNGLEISSLEALNAQARRWMEQVANVRLHRETGKRPCDAFKEEKPTLQPLPLAGYDISCSRRVRATNRCRVAFESNRYTVPFEHAGALLELRVEPDTLTIYRGQKLIAQHPRNYGRNQDIENPDHVSRLLQERKRGEDAALLARFLALSPEAESYYGTLRPPEVGLKSRSEMSAHVFLSHSTADKLAVEELARRLHDKEGIQAWLDKWNLIPGAPWQPTIEDALQKMRKLRGVCWP